MIRSMTFGEAYRPVLTNKPVSVQAVSTPVPSQTTGAVGGSAPVADRLQLSKEAAFQSRLVESGAAMGREVAATSPQRLAELKQQIADGTYQVPGAAVVDAMFGRFLPAKGAC